MKKSHFQVRRLLQIMGGDHRIEIERGFDHTVSHLDLVGISPWELKMLRSCGGILPFGFGRQTEMPAGIFLFEIKAISVHVVHRDLQHGVFFFPRRKSSVPPVARRTMSGRFAEVGILGIGDRIFRHAVRLHDGRFFARFTSRSAALQIPGKSETGFSRDLNKILFRIASGKNCGTQEQQ